MRFVSPTTGTHRIVAVAALTAGAVVVGLAGTNRADAQLGGAKKKVVVELKNLQFRPKKIEVTVGTQVDFTWKENVAHNVVFDKTNKSKNVSKGVWSYVASKTGKFKFKCTIHPGMDGELTVR